MNIITLLFWLAVLVVWVAGLYSVAQQRKGDVKTKFYALFLLPVILSIAMFNGTMALIFAYPIWMGIIAILGTIAYLVLWAKTSYRTAGSKELVWFVIVLFVPFGWGLYQATR